MAPAQKPLNLANLLGEILEVTGADPDGENEISPTATTPLRELGFDSLALLELGIILEEKYSVSVNTASFRMPPNATADDLWKFLKNRQI